jgi:ABC transporter substrate binding protein (PQQ-dependent alcohol dehydrogenase system)
MRGPTLILALVVLVAPLLARADDLAIAFVGRAGPVASPYGPLDPPIRDQGIAGAKLGIADNNMTGELVGQTFALKDHVVSERNGVAAIAAALAADQVRFVVTDLDEEQLGALAAQPGAEKLTILNAGAPDDRLREEGCAANVLHTVPSRAMLTDALAQYLMWKQWRRWFLVVGPGAGDRLYAAALRRSAKKFGGTIAVEKEWIFRTANARADTGHVTLQSEIPAFTRVADHDVLVVADEGHEFGDYLDGRTALPRPVAGTSGLVAAGWSAVNEQWGATQLQQRFHKQAGRQMTPVDYAAWLAVRALGEAATRAATTDAAALAAYLRGPDFLVAGFKGQGQSFRAWDGQMRQPILIAGPRLLVSVSPQPGYLHRTTELDTLGTDREESKCRK